jgi:predicted amidophosphoribosyltransferase
MKYCPNCGKEMAQGTNFCIYCRYSGGPSKSEWINEQNNKKKKENRQSAAIILGFLIIIFFLLLSFQRNPDTGEVIINMTILSLGIILAVVIFVVITFSGFQDKIFKLRFCVSCGRGIPFDAVICPYCRYDYEMDHKTKEFAESDSLGKDSDVKEKIGG